MQVRKSHILNGPRLIMAGLALCLIAGCSDRVGFRNREKQEFNGQTYVTRISPNKAEPLQFSVSVRGASQ